jgi:HD-GYP domain-containing protein (c-di-GMP phosphodiesterase class II)
VGSAIVSCCDAFNAMTTDRSYRDAMPLEDAIEELEANSGTQFSPAVVQAVLRVLREDPLSAGARGPRAVAAA